MLDGRQFNVSVTNMKLRGMKSSRRGYAQTTRAQSTEDTARRIVDAFVARLMNQWFDEITLDSIAEDAGVTVQTVVRRFGSKEELLGAAVKILSSQINAQRAMPSGDLGVMVNKLFEDYERTGDAVIRLLALEARHPAIKPVTDLGRGEHRRWLANVMVDSLERLDASARQRALDVFVILTDVYAWKLLRRDMARSISASVATMKFMIEASMADLAKLDRKDGRQ